MAADPVVPIQPLTFEKQTSGDTVTALCRGKLVSSTVPVLKEEVHRMIDQSGIIVLDLSEIVYMDSSGLGALVGLYVSAKRSGKQLRLTNLSKRIEELLRLTKLLSVFEGYGEYL
jgi:anti-anti-sigma factor